jgi:hypothetical protein
MLKHYIKKKIFCSEKNSKLVQDSEEKEMGTKASCAAAGDSLKDIKHFPKLRNKQR